MRTLRFMRSFFVVRSAFYCLNANLLEMGYIMAPTTKRFSRPTRIAVDMINAWVLGREIGKRNGAARAI